MKNIVQIIALTLALGCMADDCQDRLRKLGISKEIKSVKGWRRVVRNGKLGLYTKVARELDDMELERAAKCLTTRIRPKRGL